MIVRNFLRSIYNKLTFGKIKPQKLGVKGMCVRRTVVIMERRPKKRNMEANVHSKNAIHVHSTLIA